MIHLCCLRSENKEVAHAISERSCSIIRVCAILWNFILEHDGLDEEDLASVADKEDDDTADTDDDDDDTVAMVPSAPGRLGDSGEARRRRVLADFLAASGAL